VTEYTGPSALRTRGTVVVVPGRGETRATYARFGTRLAADAYRVRVVDPPRIDPADVPGSLDRFAEALTNAVADLAHRPLVLTGADSGAVAIAALLGRGVRGAWCPDAVVLAGLPGRGAGVTGGWSDELDVRTSCPVHRGVLTDDAAVERGALATPLPSELLDAEAAEVPRLVLVGDADPLADREALARSVKASRARLSVVRGAHHDVLNDVQHRSVAAEIVSFLEVLRNELVPVISVESSAW
jgi:alpha-beta hydrolase superfamily lysophospholipase